MAGLLVALCGTLILGAARAQPIPAMNYAFTSLATPRASEAAEFLTTYLGGTPLEHGDFLTHRDVAAAASVYGVRFNSTIVTHDVYFVDDPTKVCVGGSIDPPAKPPSPRLPVPGDPWAATTVRVAIVRRTFVPHI